MTRLLPSFLIIGAQKAGERYHLVPISTNYEAPPLPVFPKLTDLFKEANNTLFQLIGYQFDW